MEPAQIKLMVGLGNPGKEYAGTRHNAGFEVVALLLEKLPGAFAGTSTCSSCCYTGRFRGRALILQLPQTFMNLSGKAVAPLARRLEIAPAEILVIYDDLDLPVGRIRIRQGGSAAGHHGVESIASELGSADFLRLRIGIGGEKRGGVIDHVLSAVTPAEAPVYAEALEAAAAAALAIAAIGPQRAMNVYNAWQPEAERAEEERRKEAKKILTTGAAPEDPEAASNRG